MPIRYPLLASLAFSLSLLACGSDSGPSKTSDPKGYVEENKDDLQGEALDSLDFSYADLRHGVLAGANLTDAKFFQGKADSADFSGSILYNTYIRETSFVGAAFSRANLFSIDLQDADFTHATLDSAILDSGYLRQAQFLYASLRGASLRGSDVAHTSFDSSNCSGADFSGAFIEGTAFHGAILDQATFLDIKGNHGLDSVLCTATSLRGIAVDSSLGARLKLNCEDKL